MTRLSPAEAKDVAAKIKAVTDKDPDYPEAASVRERLAHLESIIHRLDSEQQRIEEPLKKLFADPLVADLWMLQLPNGEHLYLKDEPKLPTSGAMAVNCIAGFDLVEKKRGVDPTKLTYNGPAPQVELSRKVRALLKGLRDDNWEKTFFLIAKAIDEAKDIDAILKLNLLRQTLEVGGQGSSIFEHAFAKHLDALKEKNVNPFANWLDSKDEAAKADRRRAETALAVLPDVTAAGKMAADAATRLRESAGRVRRWTGWLRHGPARQLALRALVARRSGRRAVRRPQGIGKWDFVRRSRERQGRHCDDRHSRRRHAAGGKPVISGRSGEALKWTILFTFASVAECLVPTTRRSSSRSPGEGS